MYVSAKTFKKKQQKKRFKKFPNSRSSDNYEPTNEHGWPNMRQTNTITQTTHDNYTVIINLFLVVMGNYFFKYS